MACLACINVPALPLQIALREEPDLRKYPAAVVESDRAQALVLWANRLAWRQGIRPGMRHAVALSLCGDLRARVVELERVRASAAALTELLHRFSPHVEPSADEPGVFWLGARGLRRIFPSARAWAEAIHDALRSSGWRASAVAGEGHFTCYAVARAAQGVHAFPDWNGEQRVARQVPLAQLGLTPQESSPLEQLAVTRLGDLLRLPADGTLQRFGKHLYRLHRLAAGALADPLNPQGERLPVTDLLFVEPPEEDAGRLLFLVKNRLPFLLAQLAARQEALHALRLELLLDDHSRRTVTVRPAQPTRDERLILELLRLRLETLRLRMGVIEIAFGVETRPRSFEQLSLLPSGRKRDLAAANHALAQLRAEYGEHAVMRAVLREGHLPEARFSWEPLERLEWPCPGAAERPVLVRRLLSAPAPLPGWPREPAHWRPDRSPSADAVVNLSGPFTVSGGWWGREQRRDYYFAESRTGRVLWVYLDQRRGRWFHQGWVE